LSLVLFPVLRRSGGPFSLIPWPGCLISSSASRAGAAFAGRASYAAAAGLGRATVPELLAARDIAAGRIVVIGEPKPYRLGYWLVAPLPQWRQKKVKALVEALVADA